jgi:hypothetical protein
MRNEEDGDDAPGDAELNQPQPEEDQPEEEGKENGWGKGSSSTK